MEFARFRDCTCPEKHEEGDGVLLRPTVSLQGGLAAEAAIIGVIGEMQEQGVELTEDAINVRLAPRLMDLFIRDGAAGWNVLDEDGPVPFDVEAVLADYAIARPVGDFAADLYTPAVMRPLTARLSAISQRGATPVSTSATRGRTRKPSAPSSRVTTAATPLSTP